MKLLSLLRQTAEKVLPITLRRELVALYGNIKSPVKSYSQKGEDLMITSYFDGVSNGFYLDIGCFHPKWISNTYLLHQAGWQGFAVDIDAYKLKTFKKARKDKVETQLVAVVGDTKGESNATIYKFRPDLGWSDMDTLDYETAVKYRENGAGEFAEAQVELIDINSLLAQLPHVHFLNIDVEGIDEDIVLSLDLATFTIDAILFEDNAHFGGTSAIVSKLESADYQHLFTSGGSVCYVKKKH